MPPGKCRWAERPVAPYRPQWFIFFEEGTMSRWSSKALGAVLLGTALLAAGCGGQSMYTQEQHYDLVDCSLVGRSEEHTSELQSLMHISYAVFCLKQKIKYTNTNNSIN